MYRELNGNWTYAAGVSGTVNIPASATVLQIMAWAAGAATIAINGGANIPVPTNGPPVELRFMHDLVHFKGAGSIVFTGTSGYFVEYTNNPLGG